LPPGQLGLALDRRSGAASLFGAAIAAVHMLALLGVLYAVAPFQMVRGPLPGSEVALAALGYLTGNFAEELMFRGYLLIVLARWLGTTRALWLLALPFGLLHFPGLDLMSLGKMLLTTGAMHFVFGYVFLATRSLWGAVVLHAIGNTLLHSVFGTGKPAYLALNYSREFPTAVDAPFLVFFGVTVVLAILLARLAAARHGIAWLEGRERAAVTQVR
jgi:membrane protease YdiL (CAAX protease family)